MLLSMTTRMPNFSSTYPKWATTYPMQCPLKAQTGLWYNAVIT